MAGDGGALKDINEIKSQFRTREGFYKLLTLSDSQQRGGLPRGPSAGATLGPGAGPGPIPGGGVGLLQGPGAAAAAAAAAAASSSSNAAANSSPAGFLPPVRVSMVKLQPEDPGEESERVCFNIGRELYFYTYTNIKKVSCVSALACTAKLVLLGLFHHVCTHLHPSVQDGEQTVGGASCRRMHGGSGRCRRAAVLLHGQDTA